MAVGLIKKQIIHSGGGVTTSPPSSPLRLSKRKQALKDLDDILTTFGLDKGMQTQTSTSSNLPTVTWP